MKLSLYDVLGVARDADQAQIDMAYAAAEEKLNVVTVRGMAAATAELRMLRDGYLLLSNPERRTEYDAKLKADEVAASLPLITVNAPVRRRLGLETVVLAAVTAVLGSVAYHHVSLKMDAVRAEHAQAVKRKADEQSKVLVIDSTQERPVLRNVSNGAEQR